MSTERKHKKLGSILLRIVVLMFIGAAAAFAWLAPWQRSESEKQIAPVPVSIVIPASGNLERRMTVPGYVESDALVTVVPKVSGTLQLLNVDVGDYVTSGTVIDRIDPEPYRLALKQAKAALDGASSAYERAKQLSTAGAASAQAVDQAKAQFENASAQYDLAVLNSSYTDIISPVDGTLVKRHVAAGATVSPAVAVVTLSDNSSLYASANVPERYFGLFSEKGDTMEGSARILAYKSLSLPLVVRTISPLIDVGTKTFSVRAEINQQDVSNTTPLIPGLHIAATFVIERRENVLSLPFAALSGGDTLWYVDDGGFARWMSFTPEFVSEDRFEIPDRYRGVRFIEKGQHFMTAGTPVSIIGNGP